jgi:predicted DNA-binding transcriptional regulator AlpA
LRGVIGAPLLCGSKRNQAPLQVSRKIAPTDDATPLPQPLTLEAVLEVIEQNQQIIDRFLSRQQLADLFGCTTMTIYRAVAAGTLPSPYYLAAALPRWRLREVLQALERTRAQPADQKAARRAARLGLQQPVIKRGRKPRTVAPVPT